MLGGSDSARKMGFDRWVTIECAEVFIFARMEIINLTGAGGFEKLIVKMRLLRKYVN